MPRHVVHVEGKGVPWPFRVRRQRRILRALSVRYRGGVSTSRLRPARSYGFSTRTEPEEAVARLAVHLDAVDAEWRSFVRVWDGSPDGKDQAVRA
jgi:hypothetical protein